MVSRIRQDEEKDRRYKEDGQEDYRNKPRGKQRERDHQRCTRYVNIRITPNEQEMIRSATRRRGITISKYIMFLVRQDLNKEKDEREKKKSELRSWDELLVRGDEEF